MEYQWEQCLRTVQTVLSRRGQSSTAALQDALRIAYEESRAERRNFVGGL